MSWSTIQDIVDGMGRPKSGSAEPIKGPQKEDIPADVDTILASTQKLLDVNRGLVEPDERDSLEFRRIWQPSDLFAERIGMDAERLLQVGMKRIAKQRNLAPIKTAHFDPYVEGLLIGNALSSPLEEINPLHLLEQQRRITQMGPGGLPSDESITEEAQCHSSDTEVLTKLGWKLWPDVTYEDELACRINGRLEFHRPRYLVTKDYTGLVYGIASRSVDYLVTPDHRLWTASSSRACNWHWETAEVHYGKGRTHLASSLPYSGTDLSDWFDLPKAGRIPYGHQLKDVPKLDMGDWCEFLGWYLSEGNCYDGGTRNRYTVLLTQSETANPLKRFELKRLLERLPFNVNEKSIGFKIKSKMLYNYVSQFGLQPDRFLPEFLFEIKPEYRQRFLDAFFKGDGSSKNGKSRLYSSSSKRLIDGIELLLLYQGRSTSRRKPWMAKDRQGQPSSWMHAISELSNEVKEIKPSAHFTQEYAGKVYCARVPGEMMLTRRNGQPIWTGNSLHPSEFGLLDAIGGPECHSEDTEVYTMYGWLPWSQVTEETPLFCCFDNGYGYSSAEKLYVQEYEGPMYGVDNGAMSFLVTPTHRVWCAPYEGDKDEHGFSMNDGLDWPFRMETAEEQFEKPRRYRLYHELEYGADKLDTVAFPAQHFSQDYSGKVYCAEVAGGFLLTRRHGRTGVWSGNSNRIGVDTRLAWGAEIGDDGRIYQRMLDRRTGRKRWVSADDLSDRVVGLPD